MMQLNKEVWRRKMSQELFNGILISVVIVLMFTISTLAIMETHEPIIINNKTISCNLDNAEVISQIEETEQGIKQHIFEFRSVCNPSYTIDLPENRDKLYHTMSYVVNAQEYQLDQYDCTEKAELLVYLLKELGLKSSTKFTNIDCNDWSFSDSYTYEDCKSNNGGHLVVKVPNLYLEATSGRVIMPEEYKKYGLK
jgi:hypothetical protein